jgi:hypothetical protein
MTTNDFTGISFADARRQTEFERLVAAVAAAEREREPIARRHAQAERDLDDGRIDDQAFRAIDAGYIAANNAIAAAKQAVDAYLTENRDYTVR